MDATKFSNKLSEVIKLESIVAQALEGRVSDLKVYTGDTGEFLFNYQ